MTWARSCPPAWSLLLRTARRVPGFPRRHDRGLEEPVRIWPPLRDQPEFPRPGDGLGAVGRAELAQQVADMLLDGIDGDDELARDGLVRLSCCQHPQHLTLAAGQLLD